MIFDTLYSVSRRNNHSIYLLVFNVEVLFKFLKVDLLMYLLEIYLIEYKKKNNSCDCIVSTKNIETSFTLQNQYRLTRKFINVCLSDFVQRHPSIVSPMCITSSHF
jgi:hypothetical protein